MSAVIQPVVPSSVVACGIMMTMRKARMPRPSDLVMRPKATAMTAVSGWAYASAYLKAKKRRKN